MCDERVRLHGLDLSTKHAVSDTREPEYEKGHANAQPYNLMFNMIFTSILLKVMFLVQVDVDLIPLFLLYRLTRTLMRAFFWQKNTRSDEQVKGG